MQAIEVTGTVDEAGMLFLDQPLHVSAPGRVRVIVLFSESDDLALSTGAETGLLTPEADTIPYASDTAPLWELAPGTPVQTSVEEGTKLPDALPNQTNPYL
ncbi:hypothetical protein IQ268_16090 [Oculatella sp. LEGE 06141]|uniref:hypothetical protein n=1 Tax=Oculatella sp. LEGE 06141 TaxID=1828648 RepID=UPI001881AFAE|nr:hypothetical protein [Oculatella sp. LEGE 06141]MBE9180092.1 hypothetical protein [Oculatella sp. LEGE 06141]